VNGLQQPSFGGQEFTAVSTSDSAKMEFKLKTRMPVEDAIENWDDDDLDIGGDDFAFPSSRAASLGTSLSHHRDSISSRLSIRSDFDSNHGDDERHVPVPGEDEVSRNAAISAAIKAGIPLPQNVPSSALMGGTIKRLGGRKVKKIIQDDWDDDLEFGSGDLKIKNQDPSNFPDSLRQVSGPSSSSPAKSPQAAADMGANPFRTLRPKAASTSLNLDRFRDNDDDDDGFFGGGDTIKVSKKRAKPVTVLIPPTPQKKESVDEDDWTDLQLPADDQPLRLSIGKDIPKTPNNVQDEFEEWGEGSLGTRVGGTRRDARSNRSSSASALSPSVSSSLITESEDEGLDGLVLPPGPLNFEDILKRRQQQPQSPEHEPVKLAIRPQPAPAPPANDDFLSGLEIGDGDVFNSGRLTLNRNVKVKTTRHASPQRPKAAVSLTFTNKPSPPVNSRLPRPMGHERHPSALEPVSESGGPIASRMKRSQSRIGGHSAHSSVTSIPTPTTPSSTQSMPPSTPRRGLAQKSSISGLRNEPTTTNAQLLKLKRSMPTMRTGQSPAKPIISRYERPPSRTDSGSRPNSMVRPKTPVERDRSGAESSMSQARKNPLPFLPAGASNAQSHHVAIKTSTSRHFRRHDSESSNISGEFRPSSRAISRSTMRSPSPNRIRLRGQQALVREAAAKRTLTAPKKPRHFGDGNELDGFDDLPTSQIVEQKYIKQPTLQSKGSAKTLRDKIYQNKGLERTVTPLPISTPTTPFSPARNELPRFARDTNASRMAREQVLSQRVPSQGGPLSALTNQWKAQVATKNGLNNPHTQPWHPPQSIRTRKKLVQQKPHLIKPLSDMSKTSKCKSDVLA
jgi:hypothetical protein